MEAVRPVTQPVWSFFFSSVSIFDPFAEFQSRIITSPIRMKRSIWYWSESSMEWREASGTDRIQVWIGRTDWLEAARSSPWHGDMLAIRGIGELKSLSLLISKARIVSLVRFRLGPSWAEMFPCPAFLAWHFLGSSSCKREQEDNTTNLMWWTL